MPNLVNRMVVDELSQELEGVDGVLLVSFAGLSVAESSKLRGDLAEQGVRFRMVRNSLARRVLAEKGWEVDVDALKGNTALAYGSAEGAILAAKVLTTPEVKKVGKVGLSGGVLEGDVLDAASAAQLADVPDRDTLRAQLLGVLSGPARGLASVLNGLPSGLARVLQARADQLGEGDDG